MTFQLMETVKDAYDAAFKLMRKIYATHIQPGGRSLLDTTSHEYSRKKNAAAYYHEYYRTK